MLYNFGFLWLISNLSIGMLRSLWCILRINFHCDAHVIILVVTALTLWIPLRSVSKLSCPSDPNLVDHLERKHLWICVLNHFKHHFSVLFIETAAAKHVSYLKFCRPQATYHVENQADNDECHTCLQNLIVSRHFLQKNLKWGLQRAAWTIVVHIVLQHISVDDVVVHHSWAVNNDQGYVETDFRKVTK